MRYFKESKLYPLIILVIIVNAVGLFFPILRNDDPPLYANIAKNMVLNHDWINLTYFNADWLDKPHFPFWLTAFSYTIFGINSFAYIIPGFIFHLLGAYYTYKLGKELYNEDVGLISVILYLSSLHLMLSSVDVRAEAYLLGTIIPATYYWYKYNQKTTLLSLVLGAIFTACAMMTKGLFVLVTITSGVIILWLYTKQWTNFIKPKWIIALLLSFILIFPELLALYIQFDMHPEKIIFHQTHVSGIKWFFWDSQFGRFFNSGPIIHGGSDSFGHYFFFIHTFLWSFLPWSFILIIGIVDLFRKNKYLSEHSKSSLIFILGSFIPTFVLFSISKFQLDYYTNILIPFAAIFCANWLYNYRVNYPKQIHKIFYVQNWFAIILVLAVIIMSILIFGKSAIISIGLTGLVMVVLFIAFVHQDELTKAILYPVLAISLVFVFLIFIYGRLYIKYDVGYQAAKYINNRPEHLLVVDYNIGSLTLQFYSKDKFLMVGDSIPTLKQIREPYFVLIKESAYKDLSNKLLPRKVTIITPIEGATIDVVMANLLSRPRLSNVLTHYLIVKVE